MVLLLAAVRRAGRDESAGWMAIAIATIAVLNGMVHLLGTVRRRRTVSQCWPPRSQATAAVTGRYSPGLISGIVLYVPLGTLTLLRAAYQADPRTMTRGLWAGVAIHLAVFAVAFLLSRA